MPIERRSVFAVRSLWVTMPVPVVFFIYISRFIIFFTKSIQLLINIFTPLTFVTLLQACRFRRLVITSDKIQQNCHEMSGCCQVLTLDLFDLCFDFVIISSGILSIWPNQIIQNSFFLQNIEKIINRLVSHLGLMMALICQTLTAVKIQ